MTRNGEDLAGVCLGGEYVLGQYLGETEEPSSRGAFYAATGRAGEQVLVKVLPSDVPGGDEQLVLWRRTARLQHPHLLRLLDCGRDDGAVSGEGYLYAVLEWPDDRLSAALAQGLLSESEARELLAAGLDALRYLHAQGLVHGSIDAAHVLAVGNAIKLATDSLHEPGTGKFTRAHDAGALGALLHQALTGRAPGDGADLVEIAEPLAGMIRNLVNAESVEGREAPEIATVMAPVAPEPEVHETPPLSRSEAARAVQPKTPLWVWPASLGTIVLCMVMVLHTPAPKANPPAPTPAPAPASAPPKTAPAVRPAAAPAPVVRPAAAPAPAAVSVASQAPAERSVWRVIAYTYSAPKEARKMVLSINRRWPAFEARVFTPKGENRPPYLVALGGRMSRLEAARVLQKARSSGLPRDTFMLNFSN